MKTGQLFSILAILTGLSGCTAISIPVADVNKYKRIDKSPMTHSYTTGEGYITEYLFDLEFVNPDSLKNKIVKFEKTEKEIKISMVYNGSPIARSFKYKYKNARKELKCKTKTTITLLPPILWGIRNESNSFCVDENNNLVAYHNHGGGLFLVLMPIGGASVGQISGTLQRVDD